MNAKFVSECWETWHGGKLFEAGNETVSLSPSALADFVVYCHSKSTDQLRMSLEEISEEISGIAAQQARATDPLPSATDDQNSDSAGG